MKRKTIIEKNRTLQNQQKKFATGNSGATSAPPIGDSFMYIETSLGNSVDEN